jgi:hypothetical protein
VPLVAYVVALPTTTDDVPLVCASKLLPVEVISPADENLTEEITLLVLATFNVCKVVYATAAFDGILVTIFHWKHQLPLIHGHYICINHKSPKS